MKTTVKGDHVFNVLDGVTHRAIKGGSTSREPADTAEAASMERRAVEEEMRRRSNGASISPDALNDHVALLRRLMYYKAGHKALGYDAVGKYKKVADTLPSLLAADKAAPIATLREAISAPLAFANRLLAHQGKHPLFGAKPDEPALLPLPPGVGDVAAAQAQEPETPTVKAKPVMPPYDLGPAPGSRGKNGHRQKMAHEMLDMDFHPDEVAASIEHTFNISSDQAKSTVRSALNARSARASQSKDEPTKLGRRHLSNNTTMDVDDHDAILKNVIRGRTGVAALPALGDKLEEIDHPNAKLVQAAAVRAPNAQGNVHPNPEQHVPAAWSDEHGLFHTDAPIPTRRAGLEIVADSPHADIAAPRPLENQNVVHPSFTANPYYYGTRDQGGQSYVVTHHRTAEPAGHTSNGDPVHQGATIATPVHSKADVRDLMSDIHPGVRNHVLGQLAHLPENHVQRLARGDNSTTPAAFGNLQGSRNTVIGQDPAHAHDMIAARFAANNDPRAHIFKNHEAGDVKDNLIDAAKRTGDTNIPLKTAFANPATQRVKTMAHEGGGTTKVTQYKPETHPGLNLYHVESTVPHGSGTVTASRAMSEGEYHGWVASQTGAAHKAPGAQTAKAHPLRFARAPEPLTRSDMPGAGVDPEIKGTALHYHLQQIAKSGTPAVAALARTGLAGGNTFGRLGAELKKAKHPLASAYNWDRVGDSLKTDKITGDFLHGSAERMKGETASDYFNRLHYHLAAAAEGKGSAKSAAFLKHVEDYVKNHSYLSKHITTRQQLLDTVHRLADRHSEREHIQAASEHKPDRAHAMAKAATDWVKQNIRAGAEDPLAQHIKLRSLMTATDEQIAAMPPRAQAAVRKMHESLINKFGSLPTAVNAMHLAIAHLNKQGTATRSALPVKADKVSDFVGTSHPDHMKFARK